MTQAFDIILVGAGMVGAALATGLGHDGFRVAVIERTGAPAFDPDATPDIRVSALSAGSERYLQSLNAWPLIRSMRATPTDLGAPHLGHIVENRVTQLALWKTAEAEPNVTILSGHGVSSLVQNEDSVTVTLDNNQDLQARLVIGADGAMSGIRDMAGIGVTRDQYGQQAMVISVRYRGPVEDITWQGFFPSGPRAFLPLHSAGPEFPGESWGSLVWYDAPEQLARLKALPAPRLLEEIRKAFPDDLPELTAIDDRASFPIARQHAKRYYSRRVVLAGDSAHTINPLAGQGVNLGFQDAQALQSILKEARRAGDDLADPRWLNRYEQQRRPANRRMMLAMDLFYHLFSNRIPPVHLLRNLGLGAARSLPFARNRVARYAMGIDEELPAMLQQLLSRLPGLNQL